MADALHWFSELWLEWGHWLDLFSLAAQSAQFLGDPRLVAMHLGYMVWATVLETKDRDEALRLARLAVAAAELSGDHQQRGWANWYLAWMLRRIDSETAIAACRESLEQFGIAGDSEGSTQALVMLGSSVLTSGDHGRAIVEFQRVLGWLEEHRSTMLRVIQLITEWQIHLLMSEAFVELGRPLDAVESATKAVAVGLAMQSDTRTAEARRFRATALIAAGNLDEARSDIARALDGLDADSEINYLRAERVRLEQLRTQSTRGRTRGPRRSSSRLIPEFAGVNAADRVPDIGVKVVRHLFEGDLPDEEHHDCNRTGRFPGSECRPR